MRKHTMSVFCTLSAIAVCLLSCNIIEPEHDPITYGESYIPYMISTDKAAYLPGEAVQLSINNLPEQAATVRYTHLGLVLKEETVSSKTWTWQPPTTP